jgi:hypothetical protein
MYDELRVLIVFVMHFCRQWSNESFDIDRITIDSLLAWSFILSLYDSFHHENAIALEQMKTQHGQMSTGHVALFAVPSPDRSVQTARVEIVK